MEIPAIAKGSSLTTMASLATFKEPAPIRSNDGYHRPVPLFHGATALPLPSGPPSAKLAPGASLLPLPGDTHRRESSFAFSRSSAGLFKDLSDLASSQALKSSLVGSTSMSKEKPKQRMRRSRTDATPKKRGASDESAMPAPDANLEGATTFQPVPTPKRRRPTAKASANTDNKPPPRKRNRSKAKPTGEQALCLSTNEPSFSNSDSTSSKGIMGIYGLDTKTLDVNQYMKDVSLEGLMMGDCVGATYPNNHGPPANCTVDNLFASHVTTVLQNLVKPCNADQIPQLRQASRIHKPVESRPPKFSLDLESTPIDDNDEIPCGGSLAQVPCYSVPFCDGGKLHEVSPHMPIDTIPVVPPADFWNTLQIQPDVSLDSLLSQSSAMGENRGFFSEMRVRVVAGGDNVSSLPPLPLFSFSSTQAPQDSSCDRYINSRLNHWLRAEPMKQEVFEVQPRHTVATSQENKHPSKLDDAEILPTKPAEKSGKEGFLDIDLNKQSPEAEAAESIAQSSSIVLSCRPEIVKEISLAAEARDGGGGLHPEPKKELPVEAVVGVPEAQPRCNTAAGVTDKVVDNAPQKCPNSLQDDDTAARQRQDCLVLSPIKGCSSEAAQAGLANTSSTMPTLIVPEVHEDQEFCSDVPYSPGVQAIAHLLCKMSNSASPFYSEKDEEEPEATTSYGGASIHRPVKAARMAGPTDMKACKHPTFYEQQPVKVQVKERKERTVYNQVVGNVGEKNSGSEPWASTPPRHPPKNIGSCMSGSQSSADSDKGHHRGLREQSYVGVGQKLGERQRHLASKGPHSLVNKGQSTKGAYTLAPKTSCSHTTAAKGSSFSVSAQQKSSPSETTLTAPTRAVEGLNKVTRPGSNTGKNYLPPSMNRNTNRFSIQPRSLNGCSIKSPTARKVLPFVGEVRHGAK